MSAGVRAGFLSPGTASVLSPTRGRGSRSAARAERGNAPRGHGGSGPLRQNSRWSTPPSLSRAVSFSGSYGGDDMRASRCAFVLLSAFVFSWDVASLVKEKRPKGEGVGRSPHDPLARGRIDGEGEGEVARVFAGCNGECWWCCHLCCCSCFRGYIDRL